MASSRREGVGAKEFSEVDPRRGKMASAGGRGGPPCLPGPLRPPGKARPGTLLKRNAKNAGAKMQKPQL